MIHLSADDSMSSYVKGSLSIDFIVSLLGLACRAPEEDTREMPKVNPPATSMKQFMYTNTFQADFDVWKAQVEAEQKGTLQISQEEPITTSGTAMGITIFYFVVPRPVISSTRRR